MRRAGGQVPGGDVPMSTPDTRKYRRRMPRGCLLLTYNGGRTASSTRARRQASCASGAAGLFAIGAIVARPQLQPLAFPGEGRALGAAGDPGSRAQLLARDPGSALATCRRSLRPGKQVEGSVCCLRQRGSGVRAIRGAVLAYPTPSRRGRRRSMSGASKSQHETHTRIGIST